jgi:hypothetical protein
MSALYSKCACASVVMLLVLLVYSNIYPTRCNVTQFIWKLPYMFRVVPPPIIRSENNCIYDNWYFVTPPLLPAAIAAGWLHLKCDGTRAETRFRLSAKRRSPFKSVGGGGHFSRLLAVGVVMLDIPCSEVEWKRTGYPLHSPVSLSLPLPCVTVCHQVSTGL